MAHTGLSRLRKRLSGSQVPHKGAKSPPDGGWRPCIWKVSGYVSYALESNRYDVAITHERAGVACGACPCLGIVCLGHRCVDCRSSGLRKAK
jgi:hypothetical protein